jgi:hypothetical protein
MILSPNISQADSLISSASINLLRPYFIGDDRSMVFFVGAGASTSGNTGMPSASSLLYHLLVQSLSVSKKFDIGQGNLRSILLRISSNIGFEITLNDFWQICGQATTHLYEAFADLEKLCTPNRVHTFMAYWLRTGGTVVTTNYDRMIERKWDNTSKLVQIRFNEKGSNSFIGWREDLHRGGVLHKIHGSLDDPDSCLGALEHVGTQLTGNRALLIGKIIRTRPICFVGWRGIDPDVPPLLHEFLEKRDSSLPIFWIHFEGFPPGSTTLQTAIKGCSDLIKPYTSNHPILTDADRAFAEFLKWVGLRSKSNSECETVSFDFTEAVSNCSKSGLVRMVGITLRRAGRYKESEKVIREAFELAETSGERNAALQEIALMQQQITGRETGQSRKSLEQAREFLNRKPDLWLLLNNDFGLLSMTITTLKTKPWLLLKVPALFRIYRQDIGTLQKETTDKESVALHKSLFHLYSGRLRFKLFGWLGFAIRPLGDWILRPFEVARFTIKDAKDIHLHSRVDVMAYRAVTLAHLKRCQDAKEDVPEIHRLVAILNDDARTRYWEKQAKEIERYCSQR